VQAGGQQNQRPLACLDFLKNGFDFDVVVNYCRVNICADLRIVEITMTVFSLNFAPEIKILKKF
jgi:hypothetical protein